MSLFDSIFGPTSQNVSANSFIGNSGQHAANQMANMGYNQYAQNQQLGQAYNQQLMNQYQMMRNKPQWVYNGIDCTLKEFTELMWPDDEPARLMFILKHGGV